MTSMGNSFSESITLESDSLHRKDSNKNSEKISFQIRLLLNQRESAIPPILSNSFVNVSQIKDFW